MALKVEELFAGTNYLEELKTTRIEDLSSKNFPGGLIKNSPDSIFNKFSTFTYSKYIKGLAYDPGAHFIGYQIKDKNDSLDKFNDAELKNLEMRSAKAKAESKTLAGTGLGKGESSSARDKRLADIKADIASNNSLIESLRASAKSYTVRNKSTLANPTAANIINWASESSALTDIGFQPYSMTDFIFCKNYGKIPNNRLITLRRYPFPVEDSFRPFGKKQPIPIAQAVTWWGGETQNTLSNIGVMKWNLKWEQLPVTMSDVTGNEVLVSDLANAFSKIPGLKDLGKQLQTVYVGLNGSNAQLQQLTGIEKKMQTYLKGLYETNGPYWNRVYGPVNVIDRSTRRARGMQDDWNRAFSLNFHYSFRSFNGLSPKIVALDLISSFLNLTYNDAQFLGQLNRYFANPGLKFDPTVGELIGNLLTQWATSFETSDNGDLLKLAEKLLNGIKTAAGDGIKIAQAAASGNTKDAKEKVKQLAQAEAMMLLSNAIPQFISARSALSDRPVGEWHLVVGNPMNPIMTMGDLVCSGCTMAFDEEMGPDDFPTGVTFTVSLQQGKPRDKVAIERMFNLGQSKMMRSKVRNPSSAEDTFGTVNNKDFSALRAEIGQDGANEIAKSLGYSENAASSNSTANTDAAKAAANKSFLNYQNRIRRAYKYSKEGGAISTPFDDSLLWLYFDRGQHKT